MSTRVSVQTCGRFGRGWIVLWAIGLWAISSALQAETVIVDFEPIPLIQSNDFGDFHAGVDGAGGFVQHGVHFNNHYTDFGGFSSWYGWAISASIDGLTPGFPNQYSVLAGGGAPAGMVGTEEGQLVAGDPQSQFAVMFNFDREDAVVLLPEPVTVLGMFITNTTYTALSMRDGDPFAKKFGGSSGLDPDFFSLTVIGKDSLGNSVGEVSVYLADYRGPENLLLDQWRWMDLSGLGSGIQALEFEFASSDIGEFGINTPTYVAVDNLVFLPIPEPSAVILGLAALLGAWVAHRRPARWSTMARR